MTGHFAGFAIDLTDLYTVVAALLSCLIAVECVDHALGLWEWHKDNR